MEVGITYTEFSYMLIQAYDFWHLYRTEQCELQMGGSDQWNITARIELIGRREGAQAHGLVSPLMTTASGAKFGKSEGGNVWLDPERTSPYQFYQFWVNTDDRDVERYLKLFTFLRLDQDRVRDGRTRQGPGRRAAQRLLAREVTATVHGVEAAEQAVRASEALFSGQLDLEALPDMPTRAVARDEVLERPILERCWRAGWPARRRTRGVASRAGVLSQRPGDRACGRDVAADDLHGPAEEPFVILRKGKKNYVRLVLRRTSI